MTVTVLRDVLVSRNQLDRYFDGTVPVDPWRALNTKQNTHPLGFVEKPTILSNGRPRPADIRIEIVDGEKWVRVRDRPRGISTFDRPGLPAGRHWEYFKIPAGTLLPYGVAIVRDELNSRFNAIHYTIAPAFDMRLSRFKELLRVLARNLVKEAI